MLKVILFKIVSSFFVLLSIVVLISSIIYYAPVDPSSLTFGQQIDSETEELKRQELGLDLRLSQQVINYISSISPVDFSKGNGFIAFKQPDFGKSFQSDIPAIQLLRDAIPKTIYLALSAFMLAALIGIILGIVASLYHKTIWDDIIIGFTTLGISLPSYVSAMILALVFGYVFRAHTGLNVQGSIVELNDMGDEVYRWKNLILPAIALGIRPIAVITQLVRSSMLDVKTSEFVKTAKAKGLRSSTIVVKHILPNALNPVITSLTGWFASLLAGAFFVENIFNFQGLGDLTVTALINYDRPVLLICLLFICTIFIVVNLLTDLAYSLLDPRVESSNS